MYIVTIDVGTSSTKTALWTAAGELVAEAAGAYALDRPSPLWAEIDPERWWEALCATVGAVLAAGGVSPRDVAGVGVDAIGWTLIPTDGEFRALAPAMTWLDRRAEAEAAELRAGPDAGRLVALAANPLDAAYITPKLAWLRRHRPAVFEAARWLLDATGYIVGRLTGEAGCDHTQAYGYHCYDIANGRWDEGAARAIGAPLDRLPPLRSPGAIAGGLTAEAAARTGLVAGTPVLAGCLDAAAGALGAGVTRHGQTQDQGGQAGGMGMSVPMAVVEPRLILSRHVLPGQLLLQSGTVGGGSLGWFRDVLGQVEVAAAPLLGATPFELFSREAEAAAPGAGGLIFLPYMAGERTPLWSSTARGVFFGLSYSTTRAEILRAIMEGCAFAVYDNLRLAEELGFGVSEWLGAGGATHSAVWCQIKADVTGRPFVVARRADGGEGGHGLGLFALTAGALGWADDVGALVEALLPRRTVYEPHPARHARYGELFGVYHSISRGLLGDFERLAAILKDEG